MTNRTCLICAESITETRLGIDSCRACAAFFKRTELAGRSFICRLGERKCAIRKRANGICRSCRYDKCKEVGMSYALPRRKPPTKKEKEVVDDEMPSTSTSSVTSVMDKASLIDRMEEQYKISYKRRVEQEKDYAMKHNLVQYTHPTHNQILFIGNLTACCDLFRVMIKESTLLLRNVFDDFDNIPIGYRTTLFKNFITKFSMLELQHYTTKYFQNKKSETYMFMASLATCSGNNNISQWMKVDSKIANSDAFRVSLKGFWDEYKDLFVQMRHMADLYEREFYALAILAYCDVDESLHLPEEILNKAAKTRAKVFEELQEYYKKDLKLEDFSKRLGNLITIAHSAAEAGILANEERRMYSTMFDFFSNDELLREFFTE